MQRAREFIVGPYSLSPRESRLTFTYEAVTHEGGCVRYIDTLEFPGSSSEKWESIPGAVLKPLFESMSIMLGINYWKVHCAPKIRIQGFRLTRDQALFWNELYTKGLAEFFYRADMDFRDLVDFPYDEMFSTAEPARIPLTSRALLLNGGGKDSIVSAEMLKERGAAFTLFEVNPTTLQKNVARRINRPALAAQRKRDPQIRRIPSADVPPGYPSISTCTFIAILAALLHDYRYVVLSNEKSADSGNLMRHGLEVNHQWSKSSESEKMIQRYIESYVTPDIVHFSLLREFTEIEMARRFAAYPRYFSAFSSCNMNFWRKETSLSRRPGHAYWCNQCPKCVFMFAALSAFLPKTDVIDIFGENIYAEERLLPIFKQLLGKEGHKPFECVGDPEEMIIAMHHGARTGDYAEDAAMKMFVQSFPLQDSGMAEMERRVLPSDARFTMPDTFSRELWSGDVSDAQATRS